MSGASALAPTPVVEEAAPATEDAPMGPTPLRFGRIAKGGQSRALHASSGRGRVGTPSPGGVKSSPASLLLRYLDKDAGRVFHDVASASPELAKGLKLMRQASCFQVPVAVQTNAGSVNNNPAGRSGMGVATGDVCVELAGVVVQVGRRRLGLARPCRRDSACRGP